MLHGRGTATDSRPLARAMGWNSMRHSSSPDSSSQGSWNSQPTDQQSRFHITPLPPDTAGQQGGSLYGSLADDTPTLVPGLPVPPNTPAPPQQPARGRRGVSRRTILIGAGAGAVGIGALGAGLGVALSQTRSASRANIFSSQSQQIGHLLRRAGFGPSPADYGDYLSAGFSGSVDRLLNPASVADDLDARLSQMSFDFSKAQEMVRWVALRMLYSKRPLEEKMAFFWHGVLTSSFQKIGGKKNYQLVIQQYNLLRAKALGKFDDLIYAISGDPAMLWWLDGRLSTGHSPNENYARELMELFTMGLDTYTQNDVHQGALALTGWAIRDGKGVFVPSRHYDGQVTFLGQTGNMGLSDVVKLVCAHPTTAHHVAWRMWSFFVWENPSDSDLQPLVDAYNTHDHNIGAMVKAMLTSPAFSSAKAYRARIKSPTEFVVGAIRNLGLTTDGKNLPGLLAAMGQLPLDPPNVSGWDGDKVSSAWLSTGAWMARVNYINALVAFASGISAGGKRAGQATPQASANAFQQTINDRKIAKATDLADYYVAALLDNQLDDSRRAVLRDAITQSQPGGETLTLAGGGGQISALAARNMLYLLMSMPEYQMN